MMNSFNDNKHWVEDLIREAKEEQKTNPMTSQELVEELKELARDVVTQADKLGIKPKENRTYVTG